MSSESDYDVNHRDITTLIKDGLIRIVPVKNKDGTIGYEARIDNKSARYKTEVINSYRFGLLVEAVETCESLADDAKYHMMPERAAVIEQQLRNECEIIRLAIDAKSSETMKDGRNSQTALIDKFLANKQERVVDLKGEAKRSLLDGLLNRESEKVAEG